jgi:hypothetical protein
MEFQACGDYHYRNIKQIDNQKLPKKTAKYLFITGDISYSFWIDIEPFYRYCIQGWDKVFVTLGNQEYQCGDPQTTMSEFETIFLDLFRKLNSEYEDERLILLNRSFYDISGTEYRVAGCTLWPQTQAFTFLSGATGETVYQQEDTFLRAMLQSSEEENKKLIILSHWVPTLQAKPSQQFQDQILTNAANNNVFPLERFCIDKSYLFKPPLIMWVCGHIHSPQIVYENKIPIYINCDGLC